MHNRVDNRACCVGRPSAAPTAVGRATFMTIDRSGWKPATRGGHAGSSHAPMPPYGQPAGDSSSTPTFMVSPVASLRGAAFDSNNGIYVQQNSTYTASPSYPGVSHQENDSSTPITHPLAGTIPST
eukprot:TRINITY_DN20861_c0_g1_i1.p1 TRINITY_DN20861_c0_g1~~TRINITY_DN20861_c0_g1_i1.p1  ORF type:complete len:126 (-),score=13.18 TRINITY_DN20861_c0_g1_i1:375-752(-)